MSPNFKSENLYVEVPQKQVKQVLEAAHNFPLGGHFGVNKMLDKIWKRFY